MEGGGDKAILPPEKKVCYRKGKSKGLINLRSSNQKKKPTWGAVNVPCDNGNRTDKKDGQRRGSQEISKGGRRG